MTYSAKDHWGVALAEDINANNYPAQGLIRLIKGDYPNLTPIPRNVDVLDIGCGDARNTKFLADEGNRATGIEIAAETVISLQEKYPRLVFLQGTSDRLPVKSDAFDVVIAWNSIYYMGLTDGDIQIHFEECKRALKKSDSSRLVLSIPMPTSFIYEESILIRESAGVQYRSITKDPYNVRIGETLAMFPNLESLIASLHTSGFANLETGEEMGNWFGRQYDWWIISARLSDLS